MRYREFIAVSETVVWRHRQRLAKGLDALLATARRPQAPRNEFLILRGDVGIQREAFEIVQFHYEHGPFRLKIQFT
jgi:hypothetical protein